MEIRLQPTRLHRFGPKALSPDERIAAWRARSPSNEKGCWLWMGSRSKGGYGRVKAYARKYMIHRFTYEFVNGLIPDGLQIDHLCRVRNCFNPAHLEAVTPSENVKRGDSPKLQRAKTHCPHGHAYDAKNTLRSSTGRVCKACRYKHILAWKRRAAAAKRSAL